MTALDTEIIFFNLNGQQIFVL